jgi:hypothetical protein
MKNFATIVLAAASMLAASVAFAASSYEMAIIAGAVGGSPTFYRIDVAAGQVMTVGSAFGMTADSSPLPQGNYHLYKTESADGKEYWMYRMDSQSGRVWFLSNGAWTEVGPPK